MDGSMAYVVMAYIVTANTGEDGWLDGIDHVPVKLRKLCALNAMLAHRPWLVQRQHIEVP